MKYFVRAVKYFIYFSLLTTLIVGALVLIGAVEGNIDAIFEGGWGSIWKIAVFFAAVSAIYPKLGFIRREVPVEKDWNEVRSGILEFFADRRYVIETETENASVFSLRLKNSLCRVFTNTEKCAIIYTMRSNRHSHKKEGLL